MAALSLADHEVGGHTPSSDAASASSPSVAPPAGRCSNVSCATFFLFSSSVFVPLPRVENFLFFLFAVSLYYISPSGISLVIKKLNFAQQTHPLSHVLVLVVRAPFLVLPIYFADLFPNFLVSRFPPETWL